MVSRCEGVDERASRRANTGKVAVCVAATYCGAQRGAFHTPAQPLRPIITKADALLSALTALAARAARAPASLCSFAKLLLTAASHYASCVPSRAAPKPFWRFRFYVRVYRTQNDAAAPRIVAATHAHLI